MGRYRDEGSRSSISRGFDSALWEEIKRVIGYRRRGREVVVILNIRLFCLETEQV